MYKNQDESSVGNQCLNTLFPAIQKAVNCQEVELEESCSDSADSAACLQHAKLVKKVFLPPIKQGWSADMSLHSLPEPNKQVHLEQHVLVWIISPLRANMQSGNSGLIMGRVYPTALLLTDMPLAMFLCLCRNAAAASAYVPFFSGPDVTTNFRGIDAADGGITNNLPCPRNVSHCLKFSLEPYGFKRASGDQTISTLMSAQSDDGSNRFDPKLPPIATNPTYDEKRIAAAAASGITVQPNVYRPLPFTQEQWEDMKFKPASDRTLQYLVDLGYADAMSWAKKSGVAGAAAAKAQAAKPKPATKRPSSQKG